MTILNRRLVLSGTAGLVGAAISGGPGHAQNLIESPDNWATMTRAQRDAAYNDRC